MGREHTSKMVQGEKGEKEKMKTAILDQTEFDALLEYSDSFFIPTGQIIGKRWKTWQNGRWYLRQYVESNAEGYVDIRTKVIRIQAPKPTIEWEPLAWEPLVWEPLPWPPPD